MKNGAEDRSPTPFVGTQTERLCSGGCFAFFVRRPFEVFLRDENQRRTSANKDQTPASEQPPTAS